MVAAVVVAVVVAAAVTPTPTLEEKNESVVHGEILKYGESFTTLLEYINYRNTHVPVEMTSGQEEKVQG